MMRARADACAPLEMSRKAVASAPSICASSLHMLSAHLTTSPCRDMLQASSKTTQRQPHAPQGAGTDAAVQMRMQLDFPETSAEGYLLIANTRTDHRSVTTVHSQCCSNMFVDQRCTLRMWTQAMVT
jgi:hypothetical protein